MSPTPAPILEQQHGHSPSIIPKRKPKGPHPSYRASVTRRKLPPHHPVTIQQTTNPTPPLKTAQGLRTRRNDTTHPGFGRESIFVTRSTGLGLLIGRCRSLVNDEGCVPPKKLCFKTAQGSMR